MLSEIESNQACIDFIEYANGNYEADNSIAEELAERMSDEQVHEDLLNSEALEDFSDGLGEQIVDTAITVISQFLVQKLFSAIVVIVADDVVIGWGRKLQGGKRPASIYKKIDSSIEELAEGLPSLVESYGVKDVTSIALRHFDGIVKDVQLEVDLDEGPSNRTASSIAHTIWKYLSSECGESDYDYEQFVRRHLGGVTAGVLV